jgi:predicted aminopeptidase
VTGHLELLQAARPVAQWLDDPATSQALKERLELSQRIRDFAVTALAEPDNASYRRYADLQRPAAVWNVVAAGELSLVPKTWCFWIVGCVGYRGYYDPARAEALAAELRAEGLDVAVYPVPAYSTLGRLPTGGWLADPLLNTFIAYPEGELARLVFHELAHQVAFAPGDTLFNESFASAVEKIGAERWLAERAGAAARAEHELAEMRRADFRALTSRYRDELARLYASAQGDDAKRAGKAAILARLRAEHAAMKASRWNGYAGYDAWFARANNAAFGVLASYSGLVPAFEKTFDREGGDFVRFYAEVRRIAALPRAERRSALER